jgi:hypothetical protein
MLAMLLAGPLAASVNVPAFAADAAKDTIKADSKAVKAKAEGERKAEKAQAEAKAMK